ncbi:MAG: class I SAM-dependent methyltransferase [Dehalococcoidia bacterium]
MPPVNEYDDDFSASIYDDCNPWSASDAFYLQLARDIGGPVLDVGCGTGMLACRIAAEGLSVVGVDPAEAMLAVARSRPGSERVTWVCSDGQSMRLPQRFDLAYMTGHAFQSLLTDIEIVALLKNVADHLGRDGRFVFETRNPAGMPWLTWTPEQSKLVVQTRQYGPIEQFYDAAADTTIGMVDLVEHSRILDSGEERIGTGRLRFVSADRLAALIAQSGLTPLEWYGGWDGGPFLPTSEEIIVVTDRAA